MRRPVKTRLAASIAVALIGALSACQRGEHAGAAAAAGPLDGATPDPRLDRSAPTAFRGRALLVLSDGDMLASSFVDGKLRVEGRGPAEASDALTVLGLPLDVGVPRASRMIASEVPVTNSVIGPPFVIAAAGDGRRAYVLQTRGPAPDGVTQVGSVFTDLSTEAIVTTVDLTDTTRPAIIQHTSVGRFAHTLSLSPDGKLLAINSDEPGRTIVLREILLDGSVGGEVASLGIEVDGAPLRRVGRVEWHPSGRFLANGLPFQDEIRFFEVTRTDGKLDIRSWGAPVKVGTFPDEGAFTPDGRYYLTTDLHWGTEVPGLFLEPPPGSVTAVAFDAEHGRHRVTGRAPTDISPEGIAISPDGRFIVTGNLTRSFMPWDDPRLLVAGSLDLLELDTASGELRALQRIPIHGILPEGITFDASGNYVAATVFDHFDPRRRRGTVEIFHLATGNRPRLVRTNVQIEVPPGPHSILLVR
jgi:hypothetical protein